MYGPPSGPVDPALQVQFAKASLPGGEFEFDGQRMHVEPVVAFTDVEYVPATQFVHAADPAVNLYFPATHAAHGPPFGPVHPELQAHQEIESDPKPVIEFDGQTLHVVELAAVEYVPDPQFVHASDPVKDLYFPATHAAHGPPFGPVHPELQVLQFVKAELPAGELEFDVQLLHVELAEAPTAVEYVPAPQFVHAADPVDDLYFPATQAEHGPAFAPVDPALQVQFVKAELPASELEFDGQSLHVMLDETPTAVE
jgi:hypothetical protein